MDRCLSFKANKSQYIVKDEAETMARNVSAGPSGAEGEQGINNFTPSSHTNTHTHHRKHMALAYNTMQANASR